MSQYLPKDMNEWMRAQEKRISILERRRPVSDALAEWGRKSEIILPILDSEFRVYSADTDPTLIRRGNVVEFFGALGSDSYLAAGTKTGVMQAPVGYRPAGAYSRVFVCQGSGANRWAMTVQNASGSSTARIDFGRYGPGASANNTWTPFAVMWTTDDDFPA